MQYWDWALTAARFQTSATAVYARALPLASLVAGSRIARSRRIPLIIHFSDPIPSPWDNHKWLRVRNWYGVLQCLTAQNSYRVIRDLLQQGAGYTFTTKESMLYMERLYQFPFSARAAIIRNIVPCFEINPHEKENTKPEILHAGGCSGKRRAEPLLQGIAAFNSNASTRLEFTVLGAAALPNATLTLSQLLNVRINAPGYISDVVQYYSRAAITAVIDAEDEEPVFLATKAGEAIQAAQRVLFLTPLRSPARGAFDHGFESIGFSSHDPGQIAACIRKLMSVDPATIQHEMPARRALLERFRPSAVANDLMSYVALCTSALPGGRTSPKSIDALKEHRL
jgi:hypothetical protein